MRITVISDTHLVRPTVEFAAIFETLLLQGDMLLHCGDVTGEETLSLLMTHRSFHGVAGNMDGYSIRSALPEARIVTAAGVRIGLVHGWGGGQDLVLNVETFFAGRADIVCFGHSHRRTLLQRNRTLLVNPGSLLAPRDDSPGFAVIELNGRDRPSVRFHDLPL
jgi:uncharacterized protein